MKSVKIIYWVFTILFLTLTLFDAVLDLLSHQQAVDSFNKMKMPLYLLPFYGLIKVLAVVIILIPGYSRIKEWAYAILIFNIIEATYAMIAAGEPAGQWGFMAMPLLLAAGSYIWFHKKLKLEKLGLTPG